MLASFTGLPMLKMRPSQAPPALAITRHSASMPSSTSVKQRFCAPPSTSRMGVPSTRFRISCVMARLLPTRAESSESSRGPIQLKGRNRLNFRPRWKPYAQITRSSSCLLVL